MWEGQNNDCMKFTVFSKLLFEMDVYLCQNNARKARTTSTKNHFCVHIFFFKQETLISSKTSVFV